MRQMRHSFQTSSKRLIEEHTLIESLSSSLSMQAIEFVRIKPRSRRFSNGVWAGVDIDGVTVALTSPYGLDITEQYSSTDELLNIIQRYLAFWHREESCTFDKL